MRHANKALDCTVCNHKCVNRSGLLYRHSKNSSPLEADGVALNTSKKRLPCRLMKCAIEGVRLRAKK